MSMTMRPPAEAPAQSDDKAEVAEFSEQPRHLRMLEAGELTLALAHPEWSHNPVLEVSALYPNGETAAIRYVCPEREEGMPLDTYRWGHRNPVGTAVGLSVEARMKHRTTSLIEAVDHALTTAAWFRDNFDRPPTFITVGDPAWESNVQADLADLVARLGGQDG